MQLLPQLQPCSFQGVRVVTPVAPARSDRHDDGVRKALLPQVLENLSVFVVLNGLHTDPRSGLRRGDRTRGIEEDSVARSSQAAAASRSIHIVPTADGVPGGPSVGAVVEDARCSLRPVQEPRLDTLVNRWVVHQPFRSVAEPRVATGIAPEITPGYSR